MSDTHKAGNSSKDLSNWKPGSEPELAREVGSGGDFGVPEEGRSDVERDYVSRNTKLSDPDAAKPRAGEVDGKRTTGVGTYRTADGGGSGGDVDTDFIGVGTGGSTISARGPDDGYDASEVKPPEKRADVGAKLARVSPGEFVAAGSDDNSAGADAANGKNRGDDSFAGEISTDEASGENDAS